MNYSYKETKETMLDLSTKKLIGTDLIQWYGSKEIILNGQKEVVNRCGITSKKVIDEHSTPEFPTNRIYAPNMYNNYAFVKKLSKTNYKLLCMGDLFVYDDNVFEDVDEKNIESDEYMTVLWSPGSYKIADVYYNFISLPINMEYAHTLLTNKHYDLDMVLNILKESPYVIKKESLKIKSIPRYNVSGDGDLYIDFLCLLDSKTYTDMQNYDSFISAKKILDELILNGAGRIR